MVKIAHSSFSKGSFDKIGTNIPMVPSRLNTVELLSILVGWEIFMIFSSRTFSSAGLVLYDLYQACSGSQLFASGFSRQQKVSLADNILRVKLVIFFYPSVLTCVSGAQKNFLDETILLSIHNVCFV